MNGWPIVSKLLVVATLINLVWQARSMRLGFASLGWRTTQGRIQKCFVDNSDIAPLIAAIELEPEPDDGTYSANIRYTYQVGARSFSSTCLTYRPTQMLLFADAIGELDGLRAGQEVQVFYDPGRPSRSVILPGTSQDNAIRLAVGVLLVAGSTLVAL